LKAGLQQNSVQNHSNKIADILDKYFEVKHMAEKYIHIQLNCTQFHTYRICNFVNVEVMIRNITACEFLSKFNVFISVLSSLPQLSSNLSDDNYLSKTKYQCIPFILY